MVKIIDDKRYDDSVLDRIRAVTEGDIADPYQKLWTAVFLRAVLDIANYTHSEEGRVAYKYMKRQGRKIGGWCWVIENIEISDRCKKRIEEYLDYKWNGKR